MAEKEDTSGWVSIKITPRTIVRREGGTGASFAMPRGMMAAAEEQERARAAAARRDAPAHDAWGLAGAAAPEPPTQVEAPKEADASVAEPPQAPVVDSWETAGEGAAEALAQAALQRGGGSTAAPALAVASLPVHTTQPLLLLHTTRFLEGVPADSASAVAAVLDRVGQLVVGPEGTERAQQLLTAGYAFHSHTGRVASDAAALRAQHGDDRFDTLLFGGGREWAHLAKVTLPTLPLVEGGGQEAPPAPPSAPPSDAASVGSHGDSEGEEEWSSGVVERVPAWLALVAPHEEPWATLDAARWVLERASMSLGWKAEAVGALTEVADREAFALQMRLEAALPALTALWSDANVAAEGVLAHHSVAARLQGARTQLARIRSSTSAQGARGAAAEALAGAEGDDAALGAEVARSTQGLVACKVRLVRALAALARGAAEAGLPTWAVEWGVMSGGLQGEEQVPFFEPEHLAGTAEHLPASSKLDGESAPGVPALPVCGAFLSPHTHPGSWPPTLVQATALCDKQLEKQATAHSQRCEAALLGAQGGQLSSLMRRALKSAWRLEAGDTQRAHSLRCAVVLSRVEWLWLQQFGRLPPPDAQWSEEADAAGVRAAFPDISLPEGPPEPPLSVPPPPLPATGAGAAPGVVVRGRTGRRGGAQMDPAALLLEQAGVGLLSPGGAAGGAQEGGGGPVQGFAVVGALSALGALADE